MTVRDNQSPLASTHSEEELRRAIHSAMLIGIWS